MMNEKRRVVLRRMDGGSERLNVTVRRDQYIWLLKKRNSPSAILQRAIDEMMRSDP
jgi:hypothetical protein